MKTIIFILVLLLAASCVSVRSQMVYQHYYLDNRGDTIRFNDERMLIYEKQVGTQELIAEKKNGF